MDECDERCRPVDRAEWHHIVCPFSCVRSSECEFLLRLAFHPDLVVTLGGIPHPHPPAVTERQVDSGIAPGDGVGYGSRYLIQRDIINAESPHKVVDILDVLLMGLRSKQRLKHPSAAMNLTNVAEFLERCDTFPHNWDLPRTVIDIFHANRSSRTSVDGTFIVLDWDELSLIVKYGPVLLKELVYKVPGCTVEVGQIYL